MVEAGAVSSAPEPFGALNARLEKLGGDQAGDDPVLSVWLGDMLGRSRFEWNADAGHYAASTMKLPLVLALYRRVARGELDLAAVTPVHNEFASAADGSSFSIDPSDDQDPETWAAVGGARTLAQLAEHAITHSSNLATNLLLEIVGLPAVAHVLADTGCSATTVVGRGIEDAVARRAGISNTVCAADLGRLLAAVARRDPSLGGESVCGPVEQLLRHQCHVDQIPTGLPPEVVTASKSGWIPGVSHDACLAWPPHRDPFVLVICTTIDRSESDAAALVASLAADVWAADTVDGVADSGAPPRRSDGGFRGS